MSANYEAGVRSIVDSAFEEVALMGAFILAGIVAAGTLAISAFLLFANGMAAAPSASNAIDVGPVFWGGMILAALIVASHWFPHIGW